MWGYPHALSHEGLRAINEFAEAEHTEMLILMWETATMTVLKRQGRHQTTGQSNNFKILSPGEEEAAIAAMNIEKIDACSTRRGRSIIAAARLPPSTAKYCQRYMKKHKINQFYEKKYDAKSEEFWKSIE